MRGTRVSGFNKNENVKLLIASRPNEEFFMRVKYNTTLSIRVIDHTTIRRKLIKIHVQPVFDVSS